MITYEQFLAFVTGSILDECQVYDCPAYVERSVRYIVRAQYEKSGFDYQTVNPDRYYDWFCGVLELAVARIDYLKQ